MQDKGKGVSVWIMSKIVMLIFLFLTFSIVLSFLKIGSDKAKNDAAEALTKQVKDNIQNTISSNTLKSDVSIPLAKTIPKEIYGLDASDEMSFYTITIGKDDTQDMLWTAVAWGTHTPTNPPKGYVASSFTFVPSDYTLVCDKGPDSLDKPKSCNPLIVSSEDYRFLNIEISNEYKEINVRACKKIKPDLVCDCLCQ